jgi:hypothetical protein
MYLVVAIGGVLAAMLPARWWSSLDRYVPATSAALAASILTLCAAPTSLSPATANRTVMRIGSASADEVTNVSREHRVTESDKKGFEEVSRAVEVSCRCGPVRVDIRSTFAGWVGTLSFLGEQARAARTIQSQRAALLILADMMRSAVAAKPRRWANPTLSASLRF